MSNTTRRLLLAGAAAGAAATALPTVARATEPDPHAAWEQEWRLAQARMDGPDGQTLDDIADMPEWNRALELEELIGATPARSTAGAAVQLRVLHHWCASALSCDAMEAMFANALATVERLAGEDRA